ncbi:hypothetical protein [Paractinoplanes toevensis]|uniref:Uncharacterized protein n=1 Tax=Paractinoplanes toevensis TaxID=571911 RepID=A0A919W8U4_9ACTN|nr:hypothetical protein [Actinoplanes toevensis]GIM95676.1 hypothetical protein Ato02nite_074690 [Actinoplanes toevensis]
MTNQPRTPRPTLDTEAVLSHLHAAQQRPTPTAVWTAVADIPALLAEIDRLALLLSRTRWDLADLLAAARATLAADHDGESEPLAYLRDAVAEHRAWTTPSDDQLAE